MYKLTASIILLRVGNDMIIPSRKVDGDDPLSPRVTHTGADPYPTFDDDVDIFASGAYPTQAGSGLYSGAVYQKPLNKGEVTFEFPANIPSTTAGFGPIDGWRIRKTHFPTRSSGT